MMSRSPSPSKSSMMAPPACPLVASPRAGAASKNRLIDSRANVTRLVLDQNGRIGIGTTTPTSPLQVVGEIRSSSLNLGGGILGPSSFDMSSASDKTFSILNSNGGVGHLSVEGNVTIHFFIDIQSPVDGLVVGRVESKRPPMFDQVTDDRLELVLHHRG